MPAQLRKVALSFCAMSSLSIACVFLSACNEKQAEQFGAAANKAADGLARGLTADERNAIQAVSKSLSTATRNLNTKFASLDDIKATVATFNTILSDADVSACPPDFRAQYHKVVLSAGAFKDTLDNIPAGDVEQFNYIISQLGSSNPDFEGKQLVRDVMVKMQDVTYQLSELKAVAHKYGADQDF